MPSPDDLISDFEFNFLLENGQREGVNEHPVFDYFPKKRVILHTFTRRPTFLQVLQIWFLARSLLLKWCTNGQNKLQEFTEYFYHELNISIMNLVASKSNFLSQYVLYNQFCCLKHNSSSIVRVPRWQSWGKIELSRDTRNYITLVNKFWSMALFSKHFFLVGSVSVTWTQILYIFLNQKCFIICALYWKTFLDSTAHFNGKMNYYNSPYKLL